jgi:hypothetical protein
VIAQQVLTDRQNKENIYDNEFSQKKYDNECMWVLEKKMNTIFFKQKLVIGPTKIVFL